MSGRVNHFVVLAVFVVDLLKQVKKSGCTASVVIIMSLQVFRKQIDDFLLQGSPLLSLDLFALCFGFLSSDAFGLFLFGNSEPFFELFSLLAKFLSLFTFSLELTLFAFLHFTSQLLLAKFLLVSFTLLLSKLAFQFLYLGLMLTLTLFMEFLGLGLLLCLLIGILHRIDF